MRGDITSPVYARRASEYVWSTMADAFPRSITPTDVDYMVEVNNCFAVFEFKTSGTLVPKGQGLAFRRLMESLPIGRAVAFLAEHEPLEKVDVRAHIEAVRIGWLDVDGTLVWEQRRFVELSSMWHLCKRFSDEATTGQLRCVEWFDALEKMGEKY